jgi:cyclopropane-fatty-acyl-phospholipid synthase
MRNQDRGAFAVPTFSPEMAAVASTTFDRWALRRLQKALASVPLRFRLWDDFELWSGSGPPIATILIRNRVALFSWLWDPDLNFGNAYMSGAVEIIGDLTAVLEGAFRALSDSPSRPRWWQARPNGLRVAEANVHHHYDLGNDFYRLWLDREMVYTCAYFPTPDSTLESAQIAKMDLVCRKLRLMPGEHVVEAGCGWGALALFMARRYGVTVRAYNVSTQQIAYAREQAQEQGLADRVQFIEEDYRRIRGEFDVFVSVGMIEHVGLADYPALGATIDRVLTDRGRGLLHFIGRNRPEPLNAWIQKRIFPGAYPPTLREVFERVIEPQNFSVLDVENLRLHYAKTLGHWLERFDASTPAIAKTFDETFVRAWRLYLAGSQAGFLAGTGQLFQVVFARGATNAIPWTRAT